MRSGKHDYRFCTYVHCFSPFKHSCFVLNLPPTVFYAVPNISSSCIGRSSKQHPVHFLLDFHIFCHIFFQYRMKRSSMVEHSLWKCIWLALSLLSWTWWSLLIHLKVFYDFIHFFHPPLQTVLRTVILRCYQQEICLMDKRLIQKQRLREWEKDYWRKTAI